MTYSPCIHSGWQSPRNERRLTDRRKRLGKGGKGRGRLVGEFRSHRLCSRCSVTASKYLHGKRTPDAAPNVAAGVNGPKDSSCLPTSPTSAAGGSAAAAVCQERVAVAKRGLIQGRGPARVVISKAGAGAATAFRTLDTPKAARGFLAGTLRDKPPCRWLVLAAVRPGGGFVEPAQLTMGASTFVINPFSGITASRGGGLASV